MVVGESAKHSVRSGLGKMIERITSAVRRPGSRCPDLVLGRVDYRLLVRVEGNVFANFGFVDRLTLFIQRVVTLGLMGEHRMLRR